jgi:hypothetical protein
MQASSHFVCVNCLILGHYSKFLLCCHYLLCVILMCCLMEAIRLLVRDFKNSESSRPVNLIGPCSTHSKSDIIVISLSVV